MDDRPGSKTRVRVQSVRGDRVEDRADAVATEEPLEIRVAWPGARPRRLAVTMRTPGCDFELAAGFLYAEGVVRAAGAVRRITYCLDPELAPAQRYNIVTVELAGAPAASLERLHRHFPISSACGICGKASLEALLARGLTPALSPAGPVVRPAVLAALPERLRAAQGLFDATGGLHAAGLFDASGALVAAREDVGRHNAMDKLVGWALLAGRLPLRGAIVLVSGRASFELVQKALAAGVPVLCAVSAPSSLAVATAREFGLTLVGFLRGDRFNVYAGAERIAGPSSVAAHRRAMSGQPSDE